MIYFANYIVNEELLSLLTAKLAIDLSKLSVEKIREYFNIEKPFVSAEDEQRVREENREAAELFNLEEDDD